MEEIDGNENVQTGFLSKRVDALTSTRLGCSPSSVYLIIVAAPRVAMKAYTFANGITVPKGTQVGVPISGLQKDESIYENASIFDGFRFSKIRERDGNNPKIYSVNTSDEFVHFGNGPHAWYHIFHMCC